MFMDDLNYDIVVVGAGPAGSVTAKYAAKNGAKVLMLEKRQEIGTPVRCGEGLSLEGRLDEIDIKIDPKAIARDIDGARIFSPKGFCMTVGREMAGNECGANIHRDIFDKGLAEDAADNGADVMVKTMATELLSKNGKIAGVRAKHMGETFDINCKIVVAADGFESKIGRMGGINTNLKPSDINTCFEYFMVGVEERPSYNDFYIGSIAPGGYIWVFPKQDDTANVGIGVNLAVLNKVDDVGMAKKYLDKFIANRPELNCGKAIKEIAGAISCSLPVDQSVDDNILLVGDAARHIDPITGGGIVNGILAGKIAGEVTADAIQKEDYSKEFLMTYDKGWRNEFEGKMMRNWFAKEKLVTLDDEVFDNVLEALQDVDLEHVTTLNILRAVQSKYPELVKEFEEML
jgi:digeranylgeranylglycerophospholipid reductase